MFREHHESLLPHLVLRGTLAYAFLGLLLEVRLFRALAEGLLVGSPPLGLLHSRQHIVSCRGRRMLFFGAGFEPLQLVVDHSVSGFALDLVELNRVVFNERSIPVLVYTLLGEGDHLILLLVVPQGLLELGGLFPRVGAVVAGPRHLLAVLHDLTGLRVAGLFEELT